MFSIATPDNNKNYKMLVCASPYAMFTHPPVDQCEVDDVNKFLRAINQQVVPCLAAQTCVVNSVNT
jgi:hypothetical protein